MRIWFERGFKKKPPSYELSKFFPSDAFVGAPGRHDSTDQYKHDLSLLSKFYGKYPEVKYFP
jgi:hypothetical protein